MRRFTGLGFKILTRPLPKRLLGLDEYPELRRFAADTHAFAVRQALTLAFRTLTQLTYDPSVPQDRPRSSIRPA